MVNGINNPIVSVFPATLSVNGQGMPATGNGTTLAAVPAQAPVVGNTEGFCAGRAYAASATLLTRRAPTAVFAGYHTQKPKNGLGDYRTIGMVSLHSPRAVIAVGQDGDNGRQ